MGLFRKTMSLSTAGLVDWRDHSERAAAAERSKKNAYRERTGIEKTMREKELELREREIALMEREQQLRARSAPTSDTPPVKEEDWKILGTDKFRS